MRTVKEWTDPILISATDSVLTFTVSGVDWSGTWTGKVRSIGPEGTNQSLTITVADVYSTDTTLTVTLTGSELAALIPSGEREWRGWLGFSRSESPIKGLQGPIVIQAVVN